MLANSGDPDQMPRHFCDIWSGSALFAYAPQKWNARYERAKVSSERVKQGQQDLTFESFNKHISHTLTMCHMQAKILHI